MKFNLKNRFYDIFKRYLKIYFEKKIKKKSIRRSIHRHDTGHSVLNLTSVAIHTTEYQVILRMTHRII